MNLENHSINTEALKYFREDKQYSQVVLANECEVGKNTVHRWEKGESNPSLKHQKKLTKALGITIDQLKEPPPIKERSEARIKTTISDSANVALEIVSETYHINKDAIIDFAPLMFHALAAASLKERTTKLDEMDKAIEQFQKSSMEKLPYISNGGLSIIERSTEGGRLLEEQEAINSNHLFFSGDITNDVYDISTNPFSQFIKPFLDSMSGELNNIFDIKWRNNELPKFCITDSYIRKLIVVPAEDDLFEKIKELLFNGKMTLKEINVRDSGLSPEGLERMAGNISSDLNERVMEKYAEYKSSKKNTLGEGK